MKQTDKSLCLLFQRMENILPSLHSREVVIVISTVCVFDFTAVINRAHLFFTAFLPQR